MLSDGPWKQKTPPQDQIGLVYCDCVMLFMENDVRSTVSGKIIQPFDVLNVIQQMHMMNI